jgi:hypothetical protein
MTQKEREGLKRLAEAVGELRAPWKVREGTAVDFDGESGIAVDEDCLCVCDVWGERLDIAEFIAALNPSVVLDILAENQRMGELLTKAMEALQSCYDVNDWPANGDTSQDRAADAIESFLADHP